MLVDHKLNSARSVSVIAFTDLPVDLQAHGVIWNAMALVINADFEGVICREQPQEPFRDVEGSVFGWLVCSNRSNLFLAS